MRKKNIELVREYFDNNDKFIGGYRSFAKLVKVPQASLHRELNILKQKGVIKIYKQNDVTIFEKVGTLSKGNIAINLDSFNKKLETRKIKFTSRQHRLINYLKDCPTNVYIPKIEILYYLREMYFCFEDVCDYDLNSFVREYKDVQYNLSAYADLTRDVRFINDHVDIRQTLILSKGGKGGGIKIATLFEFNNWYEVENRKAIKRIARLNRIKKFINNDNQSRLVFGNEKPKMEVL